MMKDMRVEFAGKIIPRLFISDRIIGTYIVRVVPGRTLKFSSNLPSWTFKFINRKTEFRFFELYLIHYYNIYI